MVDNDLQHWQGDPLQSGHIDPNGRSLPKGLLAHAPMFWRSKLHATCDSLPNALPTYEIADWHKLMTDTDSRYGPDK